jgi:plasmid stability protein
MAAISVRNLDERTKELLRIRAAQNGRSMESEVRAIIEDAVREPSVRPDLFRTLLERFGEIGGVELDLPGRVARPRAADLQP